MSYIVKYKKGRDKWRKSFVVFGTKKSAKKYALGYIKNPRKSFQYKILQFKRKK